MAVSCWATALSHLPFLLCLGWRKTSVLIEVVVSFWSLSQQKVLFRTNVSNKISFCALRTCATFFLVYSFLESSCTNSHVLRWWTCGFGISKTFTYVECLFMCLWYVGFNSVFGVFTFQSPNIYIKLLYYLESTSVLIFTCRQLSICLFI